jgi:uncharacterized protein (TIGR00369 family)
MSESGFREHVGLRVEDGPGGSPRVVLDAQDHHLNPHGTVHGGVLATLVDAAMGAAVGQAAEEDERPVTVSLTVTYLKPGRPGRIVAQSDLRKKGSRLSVVEADVVQEETGDTIAHAVGTFSTVR